LLWLLAGGCVGAFGCGLLLWGRFEAYRASCERRTLSALKEYQLKSIECSERYADKIERISYDHSMWLQSLFCEKLLKLDVPAVPEPVVVEKTVGGRKSR